MECRQVREQFPAFEEEPFSPQVLTHLEHCENCRAELAQYRALESELASLASVEIPPPPWLLGTITERVSAAVRRRAAIRRAGARLSSVTTRQIGEHRVAAGSALGLAVLAGAVLLGRSLRQSQSRVGAVRVA